MAMLWQDVRYGLRMLEKNPGFTLVVVAILAMGIGANAAVFSLLDQVLFRPLPVSHPEQLVALQTSGPCRGSSRGWNPFSHPMYRYLEKENTVCQGMVASFPTEANISHAGATERATVMLVSGNYFQVLGVVASLGRPLSPEDDLAPGASPVMVLSHSFWQRRFGGDERILNQTVIINEQAFTIVGVTPPGFRGMEFGRNFDVMTPIAMKAQITPSWNDLDNRRSLWLNLFGRLKPGVGRKQAETALTALYQRDLAEEAPTIESLPAEEREEFINHPIVLASCSAGQSPMSRQMGTPLFVQMAMVGLVLLIACANAASLLAARSTSRQKEIAMRLAIGAGRWRVVRQMLAESLLLALGAGVLGLALGVATARPLAALLPYGDVAGTIGTTLNLRMLGFALGTATVTALLFGLGPALLATRATLAETLRDQSASLAGGRGLRRFFHILVTGQMSLSLVLLIACVLFAISLHRLRNADPGFPTQKLIAFSLDPSATHYRTDEALALHDRLLARLSQLPGVRSASVSSGSVMRGWAWGHTVKFEGSDEMPTPRTDEVAPGYFATMGIPVILGREFNERDVRGGPAVAMINEAAADKYFPGENPVGRRVYFGIDPKGTPDVEIVGVVKGVRQNEIRGEIPDFTYRPLLQEGGNGEVTYYVRTIGDSAAIAGLIREAVRAEGPNLAVFQLTTVEDDKDRLFAGDRMLAFLTAAFGVLATVLAALGLYGILSYTVVRRTREIGVRMALGAGRSLVFRLVLRDVLRLTGVGAAIALPLAYGGSRLVASLFYGISAFEIGPFLAATGLLVVVALLAGFLPARRASRIDPMAALKCE